MYSRRYTAEVWDIMQLLFGHFNDHQVRCVIRLAGHADEDRLARAIDLSAGAFPFLRCRFIRGAGRPYWEEGGFTARDMLICIETRNPDAELDARLPAKVDESAGPQLKVTLIRGCDGDTLCVIMNHMVCDAAGLKEYLYLLAGIYNRLAADPAYRPDDVMGSRSFRQVFQALGWHSWPRVLVERYSSAKHNGGLAFDLEGDVQNPFVVAHTLGKERFQTIKSYGRQQGATVNDVMLAAYLRSLYSALGRTAPIPCTVDLRKHLPDRRAQGICNLSSQIICDIGEEIGRDLSDTLGKVKRVMDVEKNGLRPLNAIALLEAIFACFPYAQATRLVTQGYNYPCLAMTNVGVLEKAKLTFDDLGLTGAFMTGSVKYKPFFQIAVSTFDDQMTISTNFFGTDADKGKIEQFHQSLDRELPS